MNLREASDCALPSPLRLRGPSNGMEIMEEIELCLCLNINILLQSFMQHLPFSSSHQFTPSEASFEIYSPLFQRNVSILKSLHAQWPRSSSCHLGSSHSGWLNVQSLANSEGFEIWIFPLWSVACQLKCVLVTGVDSLDTVRLYAGVESEGELWIWAGEDRHACSGCNQKLVIALCTGRARRKTDN